MRLILDDTIITYFENDFFEMVSKHVTMYHFWDMKAGRKQFPRLY